MAFFVCIFYGQNVNAANWTSPLSDIYFTGGKVGIGTTTPAEALDVQGNLFLRGSLKSEQMGNFLTLKNTNGQFRLDTNDGSGYLNMTWNVNGANTGTGTYLMSNVPALSQRWGSDGLSWLVAPVGTAGTVIPWKNMLSISPIGNISLNGYTTFGGSAIFMSTASFNVISGRQRFAVTATTTTGVYDDVTSNAPYSRVYADSFTTSGIGVGQMFLEGSAIDATMPIIIGGGKAGGQIGKNIILGNTNEIFVDNVNNKVGMGTIAPSEALEVVGNIKATGICIGTDCKTAWPVGSVADNWGTQVTVTDATLTGNGTTASPLKVVTKAVSETDPVWMASKAGYYTKTDIDQGVYKKAELQTMGGASVHWKNINNISIQNTDIASTAGIDGTKILANFGAQEIKTTGNGIFGGKIGVGTITPTQALEVVGNIKLSGNITSSGDICIGKCL